MDQAAFSQGSAELDEAALRQGLAELDQLSTLEYHESLSEVLSDPVLDDSAARVGRLVGVVLKEPFATVHTRSQPSFNSKAFREWELVDEASFDAVLRATWQYPVLETMRLDLALNAPHFASMSTYRFALDAHHESGFFGAFAESVRKYICGDKEIRKKVSDALKAAGRTGSKLPPITPETVVTAGGLALGVFLVQAIPLLGIVGAPVIAALLLILYTLGIDAFCSWSRGGRAVVIEQS
jgi:hypothetical protein